MRPLGRTRVLLVLQALLARCYAQTRAFQWKFSDNFVLTELQECQNMTVVVESINNNSSDCGVAPYYLIAFELDGVPTTSMIGSDTMGLHWQVNHREGSTLMLTMVDSSGNTGGVSPTLFNVTAGTNKLCFPSTSFNVAHITPNVTSSLSTCEPWGLTISNGTKPYSVVLSALDSPVITNVTMGSNDNVFTYIDRANPGGRLLAAVVDATGQWGYATSALNTIGSNNTDCVGLISTSQTSAQIAAQAAARARGATDSARRHRTNIIIGVVVGVGLPVILLVAAIWWCRRRRNTIASGIWDGQDTLARSWDAPGPKMGENSRSNDKYRHVKAFSTDTAATIAESIPAAVPLLASGPSGASYNEHTGSPPMARITLDPPNSPPPTSPRSGRNRKREEASRSSMVMSPSSGSTSTAPQLPSLTFSQLSIPALEALSRSMPERRPTSFSVAPAALDLDIQPDIIIQHRDGGIVQELPPPYLDRYRSVDVEGSSSAP